ncbi:MaoC family dehydratase [Nocardia neocaledoniensis NBRC 108232]|uniref:Acyl dehydratase n=1 Tax=Nocardia neocaledoniensis TaxID=236511 RepID=A0A317N612_9NOCA|nr:MaoC family dehydratase [Nocardia neocaledoniensis]PWV67568.1 acyl dehydratase [Nocardia neocaledoniensis]GEM31266.1 MaoC family dehydratase [Nocardia neocaledoniensis NBRC 108232]
MTVFTGPDQVSAAVGEKLGPTSWFPVEQARVDGFADITEDHQWLHVDQERAAAGPFGGTISHGLLTLSLVPHFGALLFRLDFGSARINYGLNKVRFPTPVPVGARLRAHAQFLALEPATQGDLLTTRYTIEIENAAQPACVAETLTLLLP